MKVDTSNTGDGVTDDTAAINAAITAGARCGKGCVCEHLWGQGISLPSLQLEV